MFLKHEIRNKKYKNKDKLAAKKGKEINIIR